MGVAERSRSGQGRELEGCRGKPGGAEEMARGEDPLEKGGWAVLRLDVGGGGCEWLPASCFAASVHRERWGVGGAGGEMKRECLDLLSLGCSCLTCESPVSRR